MVNLYIDPSKRPKETKKRPLASSERKRDNEKTGVKAQDAPVRSFFFGFSSVVDARKLRHGASIKN